MRRRLFRRTESKYAELAKEMAWHRYPAVEAALETIKPLAHDFGGEVCIFVSFAPRPYIKPHVQHHIKSLLGAGIKVALVINTDVESGHFTIDDELRQGLSGIFIRENAGFDFAAWAHIYALCEMRANWTRLFLVNDSIIGPVNDADFTRLIDRVRASESDFLGLTENPIPARHVQSFFLVLNSRTLQNAAVNQMLLNTLNLSTKWQVIDVYETQLTRLLEAQGLRSEVLFPALSAEGNDTFFRWFRLVELGFPYIKTSVVKHFANDAKIHRLVAEEWRQDDY